MTLGNAKSGKYQAHQSISAPPGGSFLGPEVYEGHKALGQALSCGVWMLPFPAAKKSHVE